MTLLAALASPAPRASTNPASRPAWTRSPTNSNEVPAGRPYSGNPGPRCFVLA
jgi:hypothetical protein